MIRLLTAAFCIALCAPLAAGLWDRDRPDDAHLEDTVGVSGGRFDRFPDAFYEERHRRLKPQLSAETLPLYDDAAVALLRLGRHADAIILLDQKARDAKTLGGIEGTRHERRAASNKAACLLARYLANGDRRDLEQAATLLNRVLQKDPYDLDAEFTLREVQWRLTSPEFNDQPVFPNLLGVKHEHLRIQRGQGALAQIGMAGAPLHLARRIAHGGGWKDPDLFYALSLALWIEGRDEEAVMAWLRVNELVNSAVATRVKHALESEVLVRHMGAHLGDIADLKTQQTMYREIRQAADRWVEQRNAYLMRGLGEGRHPDSDPAFWFGFADKPIPQPGEVPPEGPEPPISTTFVVGGISALAVLVFVLAGFAMFVGRRHPRAPTIDEV